MCRWLFLLVIRVEPHFATTWQRNKLSSINYSGGYEYTYDKIHSGKHRYGIRMYWMDAWMAISAEWKYRWNVTTNTPTRFTPAARYYSSIIVQSARPVVSRVRHPVLFPYTGCSYALLISLAPWTDFLSSNFAHSSHAHALFAIRTRQHRQHHGQYMQQ